MMTTEERKAYEEARMELKRLVRTKYDLQNIRINAGNRSELKKSSTDPNEWVDQDKEESMRSITESEDLINTFKEVKQLEDNLDKRILKHLKKFRIYNEYLKNVKGCGPAMSAVIISEIDIFKASKASSIKQYAGCNACENVYGRKKNSKGEIEVTRELVRGDKLTKGYLAPFNKFLKTKLLGVLAPCMIKSKSQYKKVYDDYKLRQSNSNEIYKPSGKMWKDESKIHISNAASRQMIVRFIDELYIHWRTIEGLEVRVPYQEEYLGHKTSQEMIIPLN